MLRQFAGLNFGGVEIRRKAVHVTADGRKLLVMHGDEFDTIVITHKWLAFLGDAAYELLLKLHVVVNDVRRRFNLPYWYLSKHAKPKVQNAVEVISYYEQAVAHPARINDLNVGVCGNNPTLTTRQFGESHNH